jgi:hypothetical protein
MHGSHLCGQPGAPGGDAMPLFGSYDLLSSMQVFHERGLYLAHLADPVV